MAEWGDVRIEEALRTLLRSEAATLPLTVTREDVVRRARVQARARTRQPRLMLLAAAMLLVPVSLAGVFGVLAPGPTTPRASAYAAVLVRESPGGSGATDLEVIVASADGSMRSLGRPTAETWKSLTGEDGVRPDILHWTGPGPRRVDPRWGRLVICADGGCAGQVDGAIIASPAAGGQSWTFRPVGSCETVLDASWAADGGVWILLERPQFLDGSSFLCRNPDRWPNRLLILAHQDPESVEVEHAVFPNPVLRSVRFAGLAQDDSLIAVLPDTGSGGPVGAALIDPVTGQGFRYPGSLVGFVPSSVVDALEPAPSDAGTGTQVFSLSPIPTP
jgi:hypothetical protein